jgi:radical SAM family uncharacterized protein
MNRFFDFNSNDYMSADEYRKGIYALIDRSSLPGQYTGNEPGSVTGEPADNELFCCLVFPEVYSMGMSNLGMRILYNMANSLDSIHCERAFMPDMDMYGMLKDKKLSPFTLESHLPLSGCDVLAFSLMHEHSYTNMLAILDLAGIPLRSRDRKSCHPFIIAGGAALYNPEPVAPFLDAAVIGEGEPAFGPVLNVLLQQKQGKIKSPKETIQALLNIEGLYIPGEYEYKTNSSGFIYPVPGPDSAAPERVNKAWVRSFENNDIHTHGYDSKWLVPYVRTVHDRVIMEIMRGCTNGCRFCQAGMVYRPRREKGVDLIIQEAGQALLSSGYDEIALLSLSSSDHSGIKEIVSRAVDNFFAQKVAVSLPSLRADRESIDLLESISRVKKSGLTFAPEAGSKKMRYLINKNISDEDLFSTISEAVNRGWRKVKLYFMAGLPGEDESDIDAVIDLVSRLDKKFKINFNVTVSAFVPKPHTPFQWEPMLDRKTLLSRMHRIKSALKSGRIKVSFSSVQEAWVEAVLSRGDAGVSDFLELAFKKGAVLSAFSEHFKESLWQEAAIESGLDVQKYLDFNVPLDEPLPWDHINTLVKKDFLVREREKAFSLELTNRCSKSYCSSCGIDRRYCSH